jgi:tetratricopeptide (TPR) repeat protein
MFLDALKRNPKLAVALIPLVAGVVFLQTQIDPLRRQPAIEPNAKKTGRAAQLMGSAGVPFEYSLAALSGFRQVIAGLLWVRADSFFHDGNYDAILPVIRLITWLDPNWLDVYATGAWHLMYNFTDTDQRSDRRYLVPGIALLNEGIENNPDVYDIYKEKGWNNYDKIKDYPEAIKALEGALVHDPKADTTKVVHLLAHAYERNGQIDKAIEAWDRAIAQHNRDIVDKSIPAELKSSSESGLKTAIKNRSLLVIRKAVRPKDTQPPIEADFKIKVVRKAPRVLTISGSWNSYGSISGQFDAGTFASDGNTVEKVGRGLIKAGPRDGARVDVRLQDAGYKIPEVREFSFEVDPSVTIMQDAISTKGGKETLRGEIYGEQKNAASNPQIESAGIYLYKPAETAPLKGVPLAQALTGGATFSAEGQRQLVSLAYPKPRGSAQSWYEPAEVPAAFAKLKNDKPKITELQQFNLHVAQADLRTPGKFGPREIDMSKDPTMYSFSRDKYDLIVSINPRVAPDFIQDRIGDNGEGLTDKRYLDTTTKPGVRMIRLVIPLTKEDIVGKGEKVLWDK